MIKIDDEKTIHITRGDATNDLNKLTISYDDYEFKANDKLKLVVVEKKGYTEKIVFEKEQTVLSASSSVDFALTSTETKSFPLENKKKTYWYDIRLNDDTTIIGYDEENAKKLIVYPGGVEND
ncbi:MAG: hypothetical protein J6O41_06525 [Clostridia bacterium]|nr:hypothetical protein [Clostridia bacterium]